MGPKLGGVGCNELKVGWCGLQLVRDLVEWVVVCLTVYSVGCCGSEGRRCEL